MGIHAAGLLAGPSAVRELRRRGTRHNSRAPTRQHARAESSTGGIPDSPVSKVREREVVGTGFKVAGGVLLSIVSVEHG